MNTSLSVSSALIAPTADRPLTPGMVKVVWQIAAEMDRMRVPAMVDQAVWVRMTTAQLRGDGGRADNVWLRQCLDRLTGLKLAGESPKAGQWGAVLVAEWRLEEGGSMASVLVPPAAVAAMRAPATFAKLDEATVYSLPPNAARLYAQLADKQRLAKAHWDVDLPALRSALGLSGKKAYEVWGAFRRAVLDPSVEAVNKAGVVSVTYSVRKVGKSVAGLTFRWRWRDPVDAAAAADQTDRHSLAAGKPAITNAAAASAPPLIEGDDAAWAWAVIARVLGEPWAKAWGADMIVTAADGVVRLSGSPLARDQVMQHGLKWQVEAELRDAGWRLDVM
jgi:hypothetical protein